MANKFETIMAKAEVLNEVAQYIEGRINDRGCEYTVIGKSTRQKKDWRNDGALMWEDDACTIPMYEDEYGYVPIPEEDLSDEKRTYIAAARDVLKSLEKLI